MYCKQCGFKITDLTVKKCPKCNTAVGKGGRFCPDCGRPVKNPKEQCVCKLKAETITATPQPQKEKPQSEKENEVVWQCSCGQKNTGDYCVICGRTKKYQEQAKKLMNTKQIQNNPLLAKIAAQKDEVPIFRASPILDNSENNEAVENHNEVADAPPTENQPQDKSQELFPNAFSNEKLKEQPKQFPVIHNEASQHKQNFAKESAEIKRPVSKPAVTVPQKPHENDIQDFKAKRHINFFFIPGLVLTIIALCANFPPMTAYIALGISSVFGVLDFIFSEKKYGIGIIISNIISLMLLFFFV